MLKVMFTFCIIACLTLPFGSIPMLGEYTAIPPNSTEVKAVADQVIAKLNEHRYDVDLYALVKVEAAEKQLVHGFNYRLMMDLQRRSCGIYKCENISGSEETVVVVAYIDFLGTLQNLKFEKRSAKSDGKIEQNVPWNIKIEAMDAELLKKMNKVQSDTENYVVKIAEIGGRPIDDDAK
ncbi:hypothetical protein AB6A40_006404 [Gnathostoma spinigerum]|uniref:Cystatin domain-containing protein n=1 Tax=Gnathostoma spinigerum TaxID=75299 RepID=A0ABD6ETX3_9BILA